MKKKIGVILPFQNGDLMEGSGILKYVNELWGDVDVVWFCNEPHSDCLKYHNLEIRPFPHGWEHPHLCEQNEGWEDWSIAVTEDNKLDQSKKHLFESLKDLDEAYFAATWMVSVKKRQGIEYSNVSKKIFGVPDNYEWHPTLLFSDEERQRVKEFIEGLPKRKTILIEAFAGSGQTLFNDWMIKRSIEIIREVLGDCNLIFASHKFLNGNEIYPEWLLKEEGFISAADFPVRLFGLINDHVDFMVCVSSGISVATSCWGAKPITKLQYVGSEICSTKAIANGRIELICTGDNPDCEFSEQQYFNKLHELLNEIK